MLNFTFTAYSPFVENTVFNIQKGFGVNLSRIYVIQLAHRARPIADDVDRATAMYLDAGHATPSGIRDRDFLNHVTE